MQKRSIRNCVTVFLQKFSRNTEKNCNVDYPLNVGLIFGSLVLILQPTDPSILFTTNDSNK